MGLRTDSMQQRNPRIARAFGLYLSCRSVQLFHVAMESKNKVEHKIVEFVTGYAQLPEAGGMNDQPVWLMEIFAQFRAGENAVAAKALK